MTSAAHDMKTSPVKALLDFGQSPWLDFIRRSLIDGGELERMIDDFGLRGVTSNPVIFEKAIAGSEEYDAEISRLAAQGQDAQAIYESLAIRDVGDAADLLAPVYEATDGADGFVSLELSPHLAHDAAASIADAERLWQSLERPNVMIKVPGTSAGLEALSVLVARGINVNVTLLFSVPRYREVFEAYCAGLEAAAEAGRNLERIASVASFFLSRIDTIVDAELDRLAEAGGAEAPEARELRGEAAIASARIAYDAYEEMVAGPTFQRLAAQGARPQRLLWASTGTKDAAYSDVKYVEALIGPDTVNTMPLDTLEAYHDHGRPALRLTGHTAEAERRMSRLAALGVSMDEICATLLREGIDKFIRPYDGLLTSIEAARPHGG